MHDEDRIEFPHGDDRRQQFYVGSNGSGGNLSSAMDYILISTVAFSHQNANPLVARRLEIPPPIASRSIHPVPDPNYHGFRVRSCAEPSNHWCHIPAYRGHLCRDHRPRSAHLPTMAHDDGDHVVPLDISSLIFIQDSHVHYHGAVLGATCDMDLLLVRARRDG